MFVFQLAHVMPEQQAQNNCESYSYQAALSNPKSSTQVKDAAKQQDFGAFQKAMSQDSKTNQKIFANKMSEFMTQNNNFGMSKQQANDFLTSFFKGMGIATSIINEVMNARMAAAQAAAKVAEQALQQQPISNYQQDAMNQGKQSGEEIAESGGLGRIKEELRDRVIPETKESKPLA